MLSFIAQQVFREQSEGWLLEFADQVFDVFVEADWVIQQDEDIRHNIERYVFFSDEMFASLSDEKMWTWFKRKGANDFSHHTENHWLFSRANL